MTGEMTGSGQCVVFALSRLSQAELIIIREVRLGPGNISQHWLTTPQFPGNGIFTKTFDRNRGEEKKLQ